MKKYLLLTSALALAACGGGSGGGSAPNSVVRIGTVTPEAANSNALITSMVSEIGILHGGSSSVTPGRAARSGSFNYSGEQYDSYKLDNVDMQIADWVDNDVRYTFSIDADGRIDGIKKVNGDNSQKMERTTATEFDFVLEGDGDQRTRRWKLKSFAGDIGLKYADISKLTGLGPWSADEDDLETDGDNVNMPVIMGYQIKKIENTDDLGTDEIVFNGVAVGTVANHYDKGESNGGEHDWHQLAIEDKNAQLKFNDGTETLTASFDNWYDVEATKGANDKINFVYTNEDNRQIDENFQFNSVSATADLDNSHFAKTEGEQGHWSSNYYGDSSELKESTAMFRYVQPYTHTNPNYDNAHIDVIMGFGGKEQ